MILEHFLGKSVHLNLLCSTPDNRSFKIVGIYNAQNEPIESVKVIESTNIQVVSTLLDKKRILNPNLQEWIDSVDKIVPGLHYASKLLIDHLKEFVSESNVRIKSGILVHGKSGSGKSKWIQAFLPHSGLYYKIINGSDFFRPLEKDTELYLMSLIKELEFHSPSVLVFDNFDMIQPSTDTKDSSLYSSTCCRIMHLLLNVLKFSKSKIFIIGITHLISSISPDFMRLMEPLHIHIYHKDQRLAILNKVWHDAPIPWIQDSDILKKVALVTHGYTGSDLIHLYRYVSTHSGIDFSEAMRIITPASFQEFKMEIPFVTFQDVFGMESILTDLYKTFIQPIHSEEYGDTHIPKGLVLHGEPGNGKSLLAFALVHEMGLNCLYVDGPKIRSKIVGESENALSQIFAKARENAPCILLIDQLDMIVPVRGSDMTSENTGERIVTLFLTGNSIWSCF